MRGIYVGMSQLSAYLTRAAKTQAQFAADLGVDQATVSKLCRQKMTPSLDLAVRIERLTSGEVAVSSWISNPRQEDDAA